MSSLVLMLLLATLHVNGAWCLKTSDEKVTAIKHTRRKEPVELLPPEEELLPIPKSSEDIERLYFETNNNKPYWQKLLKSTCSLNFGPVIKTQLSNWAESGITLASLDKYCVRNSLRVSVVNREIRYGYTKLIASGTNRFVCALWYIQMAILRASALGRSIPDFELVMQTSDGSQSTVQNDLLWSSPGPLFGSTKCGSDASISFPMNFHDQFGSRASGAMSLKKYDEILSEFDKLDNIEWDGKVSKAFFAMGTGIGHKVSSKRGFRSRLLDVESPLFDIVKQQTPLSDLAKYRYLIYAYGRCGWSRRLHELAFVKGVVLLEGSNCSEYFLSMLRAGVDYVPVREDFGDIEARANEIHRDPAAALKMAENWRKRASHLFSPECVLDYVEGLLQKYASLQQFSPQPRPMWPLFDLRRPHAHTPHFLGVNGAHFPEELCPNISKFQKKHRMLC